MSRIVSSKLVQQTRSRFNELTMNTLLFPTSIPFTSPDNLWYADDVKEPPHANAPYRSSPTSPSHISFATPESDFVAIDYLGNVPRFMTITEALAPSTEARVLTDADGFRIQHVNDAWTRLCGYSKEESHGKPLSILQGHATDKKAVKDVTHLLREGKSVEAVLTNYNKSGRKFHNHLTIEPVVCSQTNATTHFIGVLKEISGENNKQYAMCGI